MSDFFICSVWPLPKLCECLHVLFCTPSLSQCRDFLFQLTFARVKFGTHFMNICSHMSIVQLMFVFVTIWLLFQKCLILTWICQCVPIQSNCQLCRRNPWKIHRWLVTSQVSRTLRGTRGRARRLGEQLGLSWGWEGENWGMMEGFTEWSPSRSIKFPHEKKKN